MKALSKEAQELLMKADDAHLTLYGNAFIIDSLAGLEVVDPTQVVIGLDGTAKVLPTGDDMVMNSAPAPKPGKKKSWEQGPTMPGGAAGGLETVKVELIDEPFWEPGKKHFRNVEVRFRLHEDPETLTTGREQLWAEFFALLGKSKALDSDALLALSQKMFEIEEQRKKDEVMLSWPTLPDLTTVVGNQELELHQILVKGKPITVPKIKKASTVPEGTTPKLDPVFEVTSVKGAGPIKKGDQLTVTMKGSGHPQMVSDYLTQISKQPAWKKVMFPSEFPLSKQYPPGKAAPPVPTGKTVQMQVNDMSPMPIIQAGDILEVLHSYTGIKVSAMVISYG